MEEALELSRAKDPKVRMAGVERLHQPLESSRKSFTSSEVTSLVDTCLDLLKDNNFRVSQGGLLALASAAVISGDHFKIHFNSLVPAAVERLGDNKHPVRDTTRRLLITLIEVSSPTIIVERAGSSAWEHKNWRIKKNKGKVSCTRDIFYEAHSKLMPDGMRKVVSKKDKEILETYEVEKAILDEEGEDYNEDELYYKIVGGRKKWIVYGLGAASDLFFKSTKGNIASLRPSVTTFTPGIMGDLVEIQKAKQETEARLEREEEINRKFRNDSMKSAELC